MLSSKYPQLQGASEFTLASSRFTAHHASALLWKQILAVLFAGIVQVADAQLACNTKPEAGDKWSNGLGNRAIRPFMTNVKFMTLITLTYITQF